MSFVVELNGIGLSPSALITLPEKKEQQQQHTDIHIHILTNRSIKHEIQPITNQIKVVLFDDVLWSETTILNKIQVNFASDLLLMSTAQNSIFNGFKLPDCEMSHIH